MNRFLKYYWPAILWAIFVFVICNVPLNHIESSTEGFSIFFPGFDKLTHCGLCFVLVVFWCSGHLKYNSYYTVTFKSAFLITAAVIVYGGIIEIMQHYISVWRSADWDDFFADVIGALMGIFSVYTTVTSISYAKK